MSMVEIKMQQVDGMLSIVDKIKFNKITSSSIRKYLLNLTNELLKSNEKFNIKLKELKDKTFNDFSQDDLNKFQNNVNKITDLLKQNKTSEADKLDKETVEQYPELSEAYKHFYDEFLKLQDEIEHYNIDKLNMDKFVEAMADQDLEITVKELEILKPLF